MEFKLGVIMSIVKPPFKKLEFKRKYAYLHRNDGIILRHPIHKIEVTLEFFDCLKPVVITEFGLKG